MSIYCSSQVGQVRQLYQDILTAPKAGKTVYQQLHQFADRLLDAYQAKNPIAAIEISNYHPDFLGKNAEQIFVAQLGEKDIQHAIANEYGFSDWRGMKYNTQMASLDDPFHLAVDLLLAGDGNGLQEILQRNSHLVKARSIYGHGATLLHYLGSNGVEIWRQVVPLNAVSLADMLIRFGADKTATMSVYNGHYDTLALASSSAHPKEAGIRDALLDILS